MDSVNSVVGCCMLSKKSRVGGFYGVFWQKLLNIFEKSGYFWHKLLKIYDNNEKKVGMLRKNPYFVDFVDDLWQKYLRIMKKGGYAETKSHNLWILWQKVESKFEKSTKSIICGLSGAI